ncbi:MAG: anthranilate synthase component I family protein [Acidobacteria bacterium]|nr:anthranilate synthase component I family protein [Acidobacteriota bacterium]
MKIAKKTLEYRFSAGELVEKLLGLSAGRPLCLLDSGGVGHLGSHLLIGGLEPVEVHEITDEDPDQTLRFLDAKIEDSGLFAIFTLAYEFGLKLERIRPRKKKHSHYEPDVFLALYDCLVVHDYDSGETFLTGRPERFAALEKLLAAASVPSFGQKPDKIEFASNFTAAEYLEKIEAVREFIRRGDTYQTNLTRQIRARLPRDLAPQRIFLNLRKKHPAPFSAFIQRPGSTVVSASPERFFKVLGPQSEVLSPGSQNGSPDRSLGASKSNDSRLRTQDSRLIQTSPIKGTRPRGRNFGEDEQLRRELLGSAKDRAENVMIVDLLRNDLGRVCEFGSVRVEKLCDLEEHPTLFHLVSTVSGRLRPQIRFSGIVRAVFPCGSITGAPKIRTMRIIDGLENAARGLSMGAIGFAGPGIAENGGRIVCDLSVAIRTMTIRDGEAVFNVGGGIVIDSDPEKEWEETEVKAKALFAALDSE